MNIYKSTIDKINNINIIEFYKKLFKLIFFIVVIFILLQTIEKAANASLLSIMGGPDSFNNLSGQGKYLSPPYRYNYYLDVSGGSSYIDEAINVLSNFFWNILVFLTYALLLSFNLAFTTDIASLFSTIVNTIMTSLKNNIFDSYILFVIAIGFIYVVISLIRRNSAQVLSRILYMTAAIALATALSNYGSTVISGLTQMSKEIGASSIVSVTDDKATQINVSQISGELWDTLIHKPWLELESENKLSDSQVESLLRLDRDSEERSDLVKNIHKNDKSIFADGVGSNRLVPAFFMLFVNGFKMVIMLGIALIQIVFQIITILLMFFVFVLILLSIVPSYGPRILSLWAKQIVGFQIGIILTSMILGTLIKLDQLIAESFKGGPYGWFIITFFQVWIYAMIIIFRKQIFEFLKAIQNGSTVRYQLSSIPTQTFNSIQNGIDGFISNIPSNRGGYESVNGWGSFRKNKSVDDQESKEGPTLDDNEDNSSNNAGTKNNDIFTEKYEPKDDRPELNIGYEDGPIIDVDFEDVDSKGKSSSENEGALNKPFYGLPTGSEGVNRNDEISSRNSGISTGGHSINDIPSINVNDKVRNINNKGIEGNIDNINNNINGQKNSPVNSINDGLNSNNGNINQDYNRHLYEKAGMDERPTLNVEGVSDFDNMNVQKREAPNQDEYKASGSVIESAGKSIKESVPVPHMISKGDYVKREDHGPKDSMNNISSEYTGADQVQEIDFSTRTVEKNISGNSNFEEIKPDSQTSQPQANQVGETNKIFRKTPADRSANGDIDSINSTEEKHKENIEHNSVTNNIENINIPQNKEVEHKVINNEERANMFSTDTI
ncbi:CD3337/EF1877 family mobilome membrane protein [Clostridium saccharoperbutylacetonicum]|uniref:CD3337/EF1877 family mobilome membrane protein n=1 Tax=Clostridium saccharoperbutylacetonicum TaxID=36745 RepID=UPI0039EA9B4A